MNATLLDDLIEIHNLKIRNPDVVSYFRNLDSSEYQNAAAQALEIGVLVLSRVNTAQTTDYLDTKLMEIMAQVQEQFYKFDETIKSLLNQNLDPLKPDSYLAKAQNLISNQINCVNTSLLEALRDTKITLSNEAAKIQTGRENLEKKIDPTNNSGYLAVLIQKIEEFDRKLLTQFSETDTASFVGKLKKTVAEHFGDNGKVIELIDKKLLLDLEGKTPLSQVYFGLKNEIASLRDVVMKMSGQKELINSTSQKGFPFEDLVFEEIQRIARPFGDLAENTSLKAEAISGSKKGDFIYRILENKQGIVLDAKNYNKLRSLPNMLEYLTEAIKERNCQMGIIVVPETSDLQKQIGEWNFYDNNKIITPLNLLEISLKFAKFILRLQNCGNKKDLNIGLLKSRLDGLLRKIKDIAPIKAKLTKIAQGVNTSIEDVYKLLDDLQQEIKAKIIEIESEII